MLDIRKLLDHYRIKYTTQGKNTHAGWIQTNCPFCHDDGSHLGYNESGDYFNCWKCNWHPTDRTLSKILKRPKSEIYKIIKHFSRQNIQRKMLNKVKDVPKDIKLIGGNLKDIHKDYLISRNFDPEYLQKKYDLKGTDHVGAYKFRIVAPIYLKNRLVSYQARDVTGRSELRYKALSKSEEIVHHKNILYNLDNCRSDSIILVEGITDVWRLGDNTACTFGTGFTMSQINIIKKHKRVFTLYDSEKTAQKKCRNLCEMLSIMGIKVKNIKLKNINDPAEMTDDEAKILKQELL